MISALPKIELQGMVDFWLNTTGRRLGSDFGIGAMSQNNATSEDDVRHKLLADVPVLHGQGLTFIKLQTGWSVKVQ